MIHNLIYYVLYFNFKSGIPGNLPSTLIKIQILENFFSIICYEFVMLKNSMQYCTGYPVVLLQMSDDIWDIENSAGNDGYQIFLELSGPSLIFLF